MAISQLELPKFRGIYTAGATSGTPGTALANGYVYVTTTGGTYTTVADRHTVYTDKAKTTEATRNQGSDNGAIALDAAGELELWFDGTVDIRYYSSGDELQDEIIGVESSPTITVSGEFNLVTNGSFETDTSGDNAPDGWTLTAEANATIDRDSTDGNQTHGTYALHFDSTGGTSGAGTALSDLFAVREGNSLQVGWDFKQAGAATGTYKVEVIYYDHEGTLVGTDTVWTKTSGAPTSWTAYSNTDATPVVDTGASQARIRLTGLANGGTDETGECWFDNVSCIDPLGLVTLTGTQTLTNKTINGSTVQSQSAIDLSVTDTFTDIPSWVSMIFISVTGITIDGSTNVSFEVKIGDSDGIESTGYICTTSIIDSGLSNQTTHTTPTTYFSAGGSGFANLVTSVDGTAILSNTSGNEWAFSGTAGGQNAAATHRATGSGSGRKTLSGTLDRVQIVTNFGSFGGGTAVIKYM